MTGCDDLRDLAARIAAGDETVDLSVRRQVEAHLDRCDDCRQAAARFRQGLDILGSEEPPNPGPVYWARFQGRLWDRIGASRRTRRLRSAMAIAASVVMLGAVGWIAYLAFPTSDTQPAEMRRPGNVNAMQADAMVEARLDALLDRVAERHESRDALEAILDEIIPIDPLEIDDAVGAFSPEELNELSWDPLVIEGRGKEDTADESQANA